MLTKKQLQLFEFIKAHIESEGFAPSYDEMKDAVGLASKSGIHRMITALEEKGKIARMPNRSRSIALSVDNPERFKVALSDIQFSARKAIAGHTSRAEALRQIIDVCQQEMRQ